MLKYIGILELVYLFSLYSVGIPIHIAVDVNGATLVNVARMIVIIMVRRANSVGLSDTSVCIISHYFSSIRNIFGITRTNCVRRALPAGIRDIRTAAVTIRIHLTRIDADDVDARRAKVEFAIGSINHPAGTRSIPITTETDVTIIDYIIRMKVRKELVRRVP